jgi:hypothetical protein
LVVCTSAAGRNSSTALVTHAIRGDEQLATVGENLGTGLQRNACESKVLSSMR